MFGKAVPFRNCLSDDPCGYAGAPFNYPTERHKYSEHPRVKPIEAPLKGYFVLPLTIVIIAVVTSCTPNRRIIESARTPEPPPVNSTRAVSGLEADLQAMRNADFTFILLFRRRDGAVMDAEDKAVINANTPPEVNRRTLSDHGKAVIIGSNFPFLPGSIETLTSRFVMEDHSKPDAGPLEEDRTGNSNTNANKGRKANVNANKPPR